MNYEIEEKKDNEEYIKFYLKLEEVLKKVLGEIPDEEINLLEIGVSSLQLMRISNNLRKYGYRLSFAQMIAEPYIKKWWNNTHIVPKKESEIAKTREKTVFPLTDVQYAYWVGRKESQILGGNACHAYFEFNPSELNCEKLSRAWRKLQECHPMLRAKFNSDGTQEIMNKPFSNDIQIYDLRCSEYAESDFESLRTELSHRQLKVEQGQVAELGVCILPNENIKMIFDIDLLVADMQSLQIIFRDLAAFYDSEYRPKVPANWNFGVYLENELVNRKAEYEKAELYWKQEINTLPLNPILPIEKQPETVKAPQFSRRKHLLSKEKWDELKKMAALKHTTPAMILLTVYAEILERWSSKKSFLINMPLFNRNTEIEDIDNVVADFTNVLLLKADCSESMTFEQHLQKIQSQFHAAVTNKAYSGVKVVRELAKIHPEKSCIAPVVFSCNYGQAFLDKKFESIFGDISYMISQTPQVWIDFQIFELRKGLHLSWDVVDELFPEGMIDQMFREYILALENFVEKKAWDRELTILSDLQKERNVEKIIPYESVGKLLHTGFLEYAKSNPSQTAVIDENDGESYTYEEVAYKAKKIASYLERNNVREKDLLAISLPRGIEQIAAILGTLMAGAGYIPVNITQPLNRREKIYKKAGVKHTLTSEKLKNELEWPEGIEVLTVEMAEKLKEVYECGKFSDDNSAYVIFTSGSTGEPKGVEITHKAALNTIETINEQYKVGPNDKIIAVSSYDFDLSVYDVFGILNAGGTLILLDEKDRRDAEVWLKIVEKYEVTLWNSVPTLLNMLLIVAEGKNMNLPSLRLAMLSGDWIGLDIPGRLNKVAPFSQLLAMGGATEASIWSNYYDVKLPISDKWNSIPYGKPLKNQYYRVVDIKGKDCPTWVPGELWIGGAGVAKGYIGDPSITEKSFVDCNGHTWYRTGDLGRYWSDGNIEFLGRMDFQVKIRGHRIELGEIETAINKYPGVKKSVVSAIGDAHGNKYLTGYIIPETGNPESLYEVEEESIEKISKDWNILWEHLSVEAAEINSEGYDKERLTACIAEISYGYLYQFMEELGVLSSVDEKNTIELSMRQKKIREEYFDLLSKWAAILSEVGYVIYKDGCVYKINRNSFLDKAQIMDKYPEFGAEIKSTIAYLEQYRKDCVELMCGNMDVAEFLANAEYISPDRYMATLPGAGFCKNAVKEILKSKARILGNTRPLRVMELGMRNLALTKEVLTCLNGYEYEYIGTDASAFYLDDAKKKIDEQYKVKFKQLDINNSPDEQKVELHSVDVIIAVSTLHRSRDLNKALKNAQEYLKAGGLLVLLETTENTVLQYASTAILEKGFSNLEDWRKDNGSPLLSITGWKKVIRDNGYIYVDTIPGKTVNMSIFNQGVIVASSKPTTYVFNTKKLKTYLADVIPAYMIPATFMEMEQFPLSSNGKIDRKGLPVPTNNNIGKSKEEYQAPETAVEKKLAEIWKKVLNVDKVSKCDNYFELGGDSLLATRLNTEINNIFSISLSLEILFAKPIFGEQALCITTLLEDGAVKSLNEEKLPKVQANPSEAYLPFPLTDVQQSYWLGRNGGFSLGEVSTHCYFEMDCGSIDISRAEKQWRKLIARHGMMRAVFLDDGQNQKVLEKVPEYEIKVYNFIDDEHTIDESLQMLRDEMAYQIFDTAKWPLFDVRFSKLNSENVRLHISFDNIIFDGWSMFLILREWKKMYDNPDTNDAALEVSFRDYVLAYDSIKNTELYKRDETYWKQRIDEIYPAPALPVVQEGNDFEQTFVRYEMQIEENKWVKIKNMAAQNGLTSSGVLMAAYAEVLARWSKTPKFTINLTRFNRLPLHEEIMEVVGDFTSLTLLSVDNTVGETFLERCQNLQKQLWADLAHPYYSGVELERELGRRQGIHNSAIMPIVFTSGLGIKSGSTGEESDYFGEMVYGLSQTPQVWIDHQVTEQGGNLILTWDTVESVFPEGMVQEMFDAYIGLLNKLSDAQNVWTIRESNLIEIPNVENRKLANAVKAPIPEETLISLLEKSMRENPTNIAVKNRDKELLYGELNQYALGIGNMLRQRNVEKNTLVGIIMEKGWEQIVAAVSILKAGAAYLPIDPAFPEERIELLLRSSFVNVVLTTSKVIEKIHLPEDVESICVDEISMDTVDTTEFNSRAKGEDLAYVIYTSGSTGKPKGVMIEHRAALNTILDVNQKYEVCEKDSCIALSNLNFDLSVYDIFGLLIAGGTIVIPDADLAKEPQHWLKLLENHRITVWNSVPAFMQMLMEHISLKPEQELPLRLVIMSGDWIPLELPEMIKKHCNGIKVVSMGGATEAAIWSNYYEIDEVRSEWNSIPYGKPLTNQRFYIMDHKLKECPNWVTGRLYIAGDGLARGYWQDCEKTEERFVFHPLTHERLYHTGDLGRYWPDGNIEFLGREDTQVKIRGHRIELGEVENILLECEFIKNTVVVVDESQNGLAAIVTLKETFNNMKDMEVEQFLLEYLAKKLPKYLIPGKILILSTFPLSINGKVDRKELQKILKEHKGIKNEQQEKEIPKGKLELLIAEVWTRVLGIEDISRTDDFFFCGGDSLKAVKIISELNALENMPHTLAIQTLFAYPTIALLATEIEKQLESHKTENNTEFEEGVL